jgi:hypothetical protein
MISRIPIGISDFQSLREQHLEYVDKSHMIREIIDRAGVQVFLLPRPRRFGKTLNLTMLRCFFEKREEDLSHLFQDLHIWQAGDGYRAQFQRYPVIYLTFKDVKFGSYDESWSVIRGKIADLFNEHREVLASGRLNERDAAEYRAVMAGTADRTVYYKALLVLSGYLHELHGEKAIILIDEYDQPIHAGYVHGYVREILDFFRTFLTNGLKDNPHLARAVLTGILRVARESIFSGLNNLAVYSLLASEFSTCFGFTEPEVMTLLQKVERPDLLDLVRGWYNGYNFGGEVIYNPWSLLNFLAREDKEPQPFWVSTSSNDLIKQLLEKYAVRLQPTIEALLEGGGIERVLDEHVALDDLGDDVDTLFSLLVFSGYLKAEKRPKGPMERSAHFLSIPNREVREVYTSTFRTWMQARMRGHGGNLELLTSALLEGDAETFEEQLQAFVTNVLSYHDATGAAPEQVYHGFVVGLLSVLEPAYQVRSNRESGRGRPDVLIRPREAGKPGVVIELKVARPSRKTLDKALEEGLRQAGEKGYIAELTAGGAAPVYVFVVAFDGKEVRVRLAGPPDEPR